MSALAFLTPDAAPRTAVARAPDGAHWRAAAGARFERRDGWNVAVGVSASRDASAGRPETVGFADRSHLRKLELQGRGSRGLAASG